MAEHSFTPEDWTKRLAHCVKLELLSWFGRMFLDQIRGLAIDCCPWHEDALIISFLTDRERSDEAGGVKWETANWRFYNFTSGPNTSWPFAADVMSEAHAYYSHGGPDRERNQRRDELCRCCARALRHPSVQQILCERYKLAADFGLYAGHPDDPDHNFCEEASDATDR